MFHRLFIVFLCWSSVETSQRILPSWKDVNDDSIHAKCVDSIGKQHFLQKQNVEIISPNNIRNSLEDFGIVIKSTSAEFKYTDYRRSLTKNAIVFLEGIHEHEEDLKTLSSLTRSHPQGRFIVSIKSEIDPSQSQGLKYLDNIITYLTSIEKWNVVILINDLEKRGIRLYGYTLYSPGNCSRIPQLLDLGNCDGTETLNNLFPAFVNFHECNIRMSIGNTPPRVIVIQENAKILAVHGTESKLVELIVKKLNATAKMFLEYNGTQMRYSVQERKVDLAWSNMLQYEVAGTTWTHGYIFVQFTIVIPQSRMMPLWMNLILPFQAEVWISLCMIISLHTVIKLLIPWIRKHFPLKWMVLGFFGAGISKLPTRTSQRLYVAYWLIVGYIITQCYSGSLTGLFASPGYYKPMQTLDEVANSSIIIGGLANMKPQLEETHPRISRNYKVLSQLDYFENLNKLGTGMGGIATYATQLMITNITNGREMNFNVIQQQINFNPTSILLPNSSYLLEGCNLIIDRILAAGLVQFWEQYEAWKKKHASAQQCQNSEHRTSLKHLQAVFVILNIGYFLSCIVFTVELTLQRSSK